MIVEVLELCAEAIGLAIKAAFYLLMVCYEYTIYVASGFFTLSAVLIAEILTHSLSFISGLIIWIVATAVVGIGVYFGMRSERLFLGISLSSMFGILFWEYIIFVEQIEHHGSGKLPVYIIIYIVTVVVISILNYKNRDDLVDDEIDNDDGIGFRILSCVLGTFGIGSIILFLIATILVGKHGGGFETSNQTDIIYCLSCYAVGFVISILVDLIRDKFF